MRCTISPKPCTTSNVLVYTYKYTSGIYETIIIIKCKQTVVVYIISGLYIQCCIMDVIIAIISWWSVLSVKETGVP
jgi:hypothetical protein